MKGEDNKKKVEEAVNDTAKAKKPLDKEKLSSEQEDYKTQMQRVQAEFENYRRRTDEEKGNLKQFYVSSFIEKMIPVLDHFELALKHECADKNYSMGIEMIFNQFKQVLESEGVKELEIEGKKFDSNVAEVVSTKYDDSKDEDTVLEINMKGYLIGDKVIRRARVVVNKKDGSKKENKEN